MKENLSMTHSLIDRLKDKSKQLRGSTTCDLLDEAAVEFKQRLSWLKTLLLDNYQEDWVKIGKFLEKHGEL